MWSSQVLVIKCRKIGADRSGLILMTKGGDGSFYHIECIETSLFRSKEKVSLSRKIQHKGYKKSSK